MTGRAHARETAASAAQYLLLGGFTAVAAGISAQGLTGFARDNMGLRGPWPYLLFLALDGAAGVCAVLLTRRAARAESGLAPRLAVWGLVAASASFNWTHAPHRPGAPEAFGLMPVIGAVLFEFTLRELRQRAAGRADRQMTALRWLHPAERIRVQRLLAADERISAQAATRRVRTEQAARRLHQLRRALHARDRAARPGTLAARRARIAERRAHAALIRAGFGDPAIAGDALRQVQVLTRTAHLALLDYTTPDAARDIIASLITVGPPRPGVAGPVARRSRRHVQEPPFPGCCSGRSQPARPAAARTRRHTSAGNSARGQRARSCRPRRSPRRRDHRSRCGHPGRSPPARRAAQPENAWRQAPPRRLPCRQPQPARAAGRSLRPDRSKLTARPGKTPGGPAASAHLVNGSDTALASRLPGHEPGPVPPGRGGQR